MNSLKLENFSISSGARREGMAGSIVRYYTTKSFLSINISSNKIEDPSC